MRLRTSHFKAPFWMWTFLLSTGDSYLLSSVFLKSWDSVLQICPAIYKPSTSAPSASACCVTWIADLCHQRFLSVLKQFDPEITVRAWVYESYLRGLFWLRCALFPRGPHTGALVLTCEGQTWWVRDGAWWNLMGPPAGAVPRRN